MNRITVYKDYKDYRNVLNNNLATRTILEDEELPKGCFYTEKDALDSYHKKEQARLDHYNKHIVTASEFLDNVEKEIREVLSKHNASLYFTFQGDSHGIHNEGLEVSVIIEGNEYTRSIEF